MKKPILKIFVLSLVIGVLMSVWYLVAVWVNIPTIQTWTRNDFISAEKGPSEQDLLRQHWALSAGDPLEAARSNGQHEDPWLYGIGFGDDVTVPGIPKDSPVLTKKMLPVRVISWTGGTTASDQDKQLDRIANYYARVYNVETVKILSTD